MGRSGARIGEFISYSESFFIDEGGLELRACSSDCGTNPRGKKSTIANNRSQRVLAAEEFL